MRTEQETNRSPREQAALDEMQALITRHYPTASFEVARGDDPEGWYLTASVDVPDPDEVVDVILPRLMEVQIDEGLPVYVIPVRTPERVAALLREREAQPELPAVPYLIPEGGV